MKRDPPRGGGPVSRSIGRAADTASLSENAGFEALTGIQDAALVARVVNAFRPMVEAGPNACVRFIIESVGDLDALRSLLATLEMMNERGDFRVVLH